MRRLSGMRSLRMRINRAGIPAVRLKCAYGNDKLPNMRNAVTIEHLNDKGGGNLCVYMFPPPFTLSDRNCVIA